MSIPKRRSIKLPSKGRRARLVNPLRVAREVGNTIKPPTGPVLTRPRRDNRVARTTIGETRNGKGPTTNEASQGTHIGVTKSVNGISRAEFRKMGKGKLMQALARLNGGRERRSRVQEGGKMIFKRPPRKSTSLGATLAGNITKKVMAEVQPTRAMTNQVKTLDVNIRLRNPRGSRGISLKKAQSVNELGIRGRRRQNTTNRSVRR